MIIGAVQARAQILHALILPVLRCELIDDGFEGVQGAEGLVAWKVVLGFRGAARDSNRLIVEANTNVMLAQGLASLLGE